MTRNAAVLGCLPVSLVALPALARDDAGGAPRLQACQADWSRFCGAVKPGDGRIMACMLSNLDRLFDVCAKIVRDKAQAERDARERNARKGQ